MITVQQILTACADLGMALWGSIAYDTPKIAEEYIENNSKNKKFEANT